MSGVFGGVVGGVVGVLFVLFGFGVEKKRSTGGKLEKIEEMNHKIPKAGDQETTTYQHSHK